MVTGHWKVNAFKRPNLNLNFPSLLGVSFNKLMRRRCIIVTWMYRIYLDLLHFSQNQNSFHFKELLTLPHCSFTNSKHQILPCLCSFFLFVSEFVAFDTAFVCGACILFLAGCRWTICTSTSSSRVPMTGLWTRHISIAMCFLNHPYRFLHYTNLPLPIRCPIHDPCDKQSILLASNHTRRSEVKIVQEARAWSGKKWNWCSF